MFKWTEAAPIEKVGENTWKIQGAAFLEDVSEELGISLFCEEYDIFSGFILHELGSLPEGWCPAIDADT